MIPAKHECTTFTCEKIDVQTKAQKDAIDIYTVFSCIGFAALIGWVFKTYIHAVIYRIMNWRMEEDIDTVQAGILFRKVTGEHAYVPNVKRYEIIDPILCADVNGIPDRRYPTTLGSVYKKSKKHVKDAEAGKDKGEILTVVDPEDFKGLSGPKLTATFKNMFSEVKYYEPVGFTTRIENLGRQNRGWVANLGNLASLGVGNVVKAGGSLVGGTGASSPPPISNPTRAAAPVPTPNAVVSGTPQVVQQQPAAVDVLPEGWEVRKTPEGRTFYQNRNTKKTSRQLPRA